MRQRHPDGHGRRRIGALLGKIIERIPFEGVRDVSKQAQVPMPAIEPHLRRSDFCEVHLGYREADGVGRDQAVPAVRLPILSLFLDGEGGGEGD